VTKSSTGCAIVGAGETAYSANSGRSEAALATEAALAAIGDAGLEPADIDGIVRCDYDPVGHNDLAAWLGLPRLRFSGIAGPGGSAPCAMVGLAVNAIRSGQASAVLAYRALNGRSGQPIGSLQSQPERVGGRGTYDEMYLPYGLFAPMHGFAMLARRHMIEYATPEQAFAHVALACRAHANRNPRAQMHARKLAMSDYLAAPMVARPFRLFDCCLQTDGACAVVVTSMDRARDCRKRPAEILAAASGGDEIMPGMLTSMFTTFSRARMDRTAGAAVARELYRAADLSPADVDVAQLYDCFTITVLLLLADFGFCEAAAVGEFVADGRIELGGRLPINTSGGHLSEGYIHGMNHVVEGARQIWGESTAQVANAKVCLVASAPFPTSSALLLGRS
jgi:acetyl-CoA acetyltransferase